MSHESIVICCLIAFAVVCALIAGAQEGKERPWYPPAPSLDKIQEQHERRQAAIQHAKESGATCFLMESETGSIYRYDQHPSELADLILPNGWYSVEGKTMMVIFQQVVGKLHILESDIKLPEIKFVTAKRKR